MEAERGALAWKSAFKSRFSGSAGGSKQVVRVGGANLVLACGGLIVRPADGKVLYEPGYEVFGAPWATPVVGEGTMYQASNFSLERLVALKLPATADEPFKPEMNKKLAEVTPQTYGLPAGYKKRTDWDFCLLASPLYLDGKIYWVTESGLFGVADAKTGQVLYGEKLDLHPAFAYVNAPGVTSSLALGGKHIYVFDNQGTALVLEPGPPPKRVAKNFLEQYVRASTIAGRPS